jgi:hypothetical protein
MNSSMFSPSSGSPGRESIEQNLPSNNESSPLNMGSIPIDSGNLNSVPNNSTSGHQELLPEFHRMQQTMLTMMNSMQSMMKFMMDRTAVPNSGFDPQFRSTGTIPTPLDRTSINQLEERKEISSQLLNESMAAQTPLKSSLSTILAARVAQTLQLILALL